MQDVLVSVSVFHARSPGVCKCIPGKNSWCLLVYSMQEVLVSLSVFQAISPGVLECIP